MGAVIFSLPITARLTSQSAVPMWCRVYNSRHQTGNTKVVLAQPSLPATKYLAPNVMEMRNDDVPLSKSTANSLGRRPRFSEGTVIKSVLTLNWSPWWLYFGRLYVKNGVTSTQKFIDEEWVVYWSSSHACTEMPTFWGYAGPLNQGKHRWWWRDASRLWNIGISTYAYNRLN